MTTFSVWCVVVHQSATTIKPLPVEMGSFKTSIISLTAKYSAGKPWVPTFMWMPLHANHPPKHPFIWSTTPTALAHPDDIMSSSSRTIRADQRRARCDEELTESTYIDLYGTCIKCYHLLSAVRVSQSFPLEHTANLYWSYDQPVVLMLWCMGVNFVDPM